MKKYFFASCLLAMAFPVMAAYTGHVYVDKNHNGVFDKGEKPLAGVKVSDGLNVVETASDGSFSLSGHERERFLFITTPSGYKTFNGHYRKIESGKEEYDFGVMPYKGGIGKDGSHKYIHIADTEIFNTENQEDWVGNVRGYVANEQAAFIIHTGDICYEKGLKAHIGLMNTENMDCPMFYCIGNHDLVKGKYGEELFESIYGPVYYSFDVGSTHYIVTPMPGGDHRPGYTRSDVCRWLKNDLAHVKPGTPVVVFNHDVLTTGDRFIYKGGEGESVDLDAYNLKAWVYGHWHINYVKLQGKVRTVCTSSLDKGGIDHSTSAFRVMHVDGKGDFTTELRYTYLNKNICIAAPGEMTDAGRVPLAVNVYSSVSPVKEVTYSCFVDGKKVMAGKRLSQSTDWSWNGDFVLSDKYRGKQLTLKVLARFNNGETAEAEKIVMCASKPMPLPVADTDWNNLLGNAGHAAPLYALPDSMPRLAWSRNVGANIYMTSPLVHAGKVFTASVDEELQGKAHVYALDGTDGRMLWSCPVRNSVKNTIAAEDGLVFAQDAEGYLYAMDAETGKLCWEKHLPVEDLPALIEGLVVDEGIVYAGTGKGLCAVEAKTGKEVWRNESWKQGEGTTSTWTVENGLLVSGAQWRALYGNDARTGKLLWSAAKNGLSNRGASPAMHGSLLYLVSDKSFFILEAATGRVVVRKPLFMNVDVTSTPLLTDEEIIFGTAQNGLVALDRETLEEKWTCPVGDALVYTCPYTRSKSATIETSPVCAGNTVYVAASDGTLYGVNRQSGKIVWKHATGAPLFGTPALSGNTLVVTDFGGNVYAFRIPR